MVDTAISIGGAARAYRTSQAIPAAPSLGREAGTPSFAELVERGARNTVETVREGNRAAVAGLRGEMPVQQVVEATMAMETALKVTVSLRDKMVEAYQEILRMPV